MTTETPVNGSAPTPEEQAQAMQQSQVMLQAAVDQYGVALVRSKSINGEPTVNLIDMLVEGALTKIQLALLIEALANCGIVNAVAWKSVLAQRLQSAAAELNKPQIAIAVGRTLKGN
jgi:hypothetical protein